MKTNVIITYCSNILSILASLSYFYIFLQLESSETAYEFFLINAVMSYSALAFSGINGMIMRNIAQHQSFNSISETMTLYFITSCVIGFGIAVVMLFESQYKTSNVLLLTLIILIFHAISFIKPLNYGLGDIKKIEYIAITTSVLKVIIFLLTYSNLKEGYHLLIVYALLQLLEPFFIMCFCGARWMKSIARLKWPSRNSTTEYYKAMTTSLGASGIRMLITICGSNQLANSDFVEFQFTKRCLEILDGIANSVAKLFVITNLRDKIKVRFSEFVSIFWIALVINTIFALIIEIELIEFLTGKTQIGYVLMLILFLASSRYFSIVSGSALMANTIIGHNSLLVLCGLAIILYISNTDLALTVVIISASYLLAAHYIFVLNRLEVFQNIRSGHLVVNICPVILLCFTVTWIYYA